MASTALIKSSQLCHLKVKDIDRERRQLRIDDGKGAKDRMVELSPTLLVHLRQYYRWFGPARWLFPGKDPRVALGPSNAQKAFKRAKRQVGIDKVGGIHRLRHAYATHQLAAGMPITKLQHQLGHKDIRTTMRYLHWLPSYQGGDDGTDLIADLEADHEKKK